jgi:hypothetical protein
MRLLCIGSANNLKTLNDIVEMGHGFCRKRQSRQLSIVISVLLDRAPFAVYRDLVNDRMEAVARVVGAKQRQEVRR